MLKKNTLNVSTTSTTCSNAVTSITCYIKYNKKRPSILTASAMTNMLPRGVAFSSGRNSQIVDLDREVQNKLQLVIPT